MFSLPSARAFRVTFFTVILLTAVAALAPAVPFEPGFDNVDKIEHFAVFAVLGGLALFAFPQAPRRLIVERLSFFGAAIEVLQSIPALNRDCDVLDWGADTLGATMAVLLLARLIPALRARAG